MAECVNNPTETPYNWCYDWTLADENLVLIGPRIGVMITLKHIKLISYCRHYEMTFTSCLTFFKKLGSRMK
jgi:hypothetical protein